MALFFFLPAIFHYICIRKSYPNRQSDADHSKLNGCQPITQKRSKFSNHLNFKQVYSFCRITEYFRLIEKTFYLCDALVQKVISFSLDNLMIKRESGASPEQSRCCKFRVYCRQSLKPLE